MTTSNSYVNKICKIFLCVDLVGFFVHRFLRFALFVWIQYVIVRFVLCALRLARIACRIVSKPDFLATARFCC